MTPELFQAETELIWLGLPFVTVFLIVSGVLRLLNWFNSRLHDSKMRLENVLALLSFSIFEVFGLFSNYFQFQ